MPLALKTKDLKITMNESRIEVLKLCIATVYPPRQVNFLHQCKEMRIGKQLQKHGNAGDILLTQLHASYSGPIGKLATIECTIP